ncbi:MAG: hypothetical protein IJ364_03855 [Oscillospiraceae bacterium]|nr:hypothetical protein [Oscillospiraceae bacterium]
MKRFCLCISLIFTLLLSGCGTGKEEKLLSDFSSALSERKDLGFVGKLRFEYENRTVDFTLQYRQAEHGCEITVLEPEIIEGLKVQLDEKGSVLEYDELFIDTGELDNFGLSPLSALPLFVSSLQTGYLDSVRSESDYYVYGLVPDDNSTVEVWFEKDSMVPVHAEISSEGIVRVFCDIESWR